MRVVRVDEVEPQGDGRLARVWIRVGTKDTERTFVLMPVKDVMNLTEERTSFVASTGLHRFVSEWEPDHDD